MSPFHREINVQSFPVKVWFGGFESNTFTLQNNGWEISMEQDVGCLSAARAGIRLAMKHPQYGLFAISNRVDFDYYAMAEYNHAIQYLADFGFKIARMASRVQVERLVECGAFNFQAIDATPSFAQREIKDLEDLIPFRPVKGELIYTDPGDVDALLAFIKKAQAPKQAEIRERVRKEKARRMLNIGSIIEVDNDIPAYEGIIQLVKVG